MKRKALMELMKLGPLLVVAAMGFGVIRCASNKPEENKEPEVGAKDKKEEVKEESKDKKEADKPKPIVTTPDKPKTSK